jgi:hypothetical protein
MQCISAVQQWPYLWVTLSWTFVSDTPEKCNVYLTDTVHSVLRHGSGLTLLASEFEQLGLTRVMGFNRVIPAP